MKKDEGTMDIFLQRLKQEWKLLWNERFDDKVRAEGVAAGDYPLVLADRGQVIFATRGAKTPSFNDVVDYWAAKGQVYRPDPAFGGWGRFIRTELKKPAHERAREYRTHEPKRDKKRQPKKNGRGWLHKQ